MYKKYEGMFSPVDIAPFEGLHEEVTVPKDAGLLSYNINLFTHQTANHAATIFIFGALMVESLVLMFPQLIGKLLGKSTTGWTKLLSAAPVSIKEDLEKAMNGVGTFSFSSKRKIG
jgi:hypothetical protein